MTHLASPLIFLDLTQEEMSSLWHKHGEHAALTPEKIELAKKFATQMLEKCDLSHFHKCVEINKKNKGVIENLWQDMNGPGILTSALKNFCADVAIEAFSKMHVPQKTSTKTIKP